MQLSSLELKLKDLEDILATISPGMAAKHHVWLSRGKNVAFGI